MKLNDLVPAEGSVKEPKRKGRGAGTGNGKTAGKGHKGQKARSGGGVRPGFEGGQMPLQRRMPKRGFCNMAFSKDYQIVNLCDLDRFEDGSVVTAKELCEKGLIRKESEPVKILGLGEITNKLTVKADKFSKSAAEKIEAVGGKAEVK